MTQIFLPERSMKCNNLRFGKYSNSEDGIFFTGFGSLTDSALVDVLQVRWNVTHQTSDGFLENMLCSSFLSLRGSEVNISLKKGRKKNVFLLKS